MIGDGALRARRPERGAFLDLVTAVQGPLRQFVRQRIRPADLADDLVQQTFLKAWSHEGFDPSRADASSFLSTIADHLVTDRLRSLESGSVSLDDLSARGSLAPSVVDLHARDPLARMIAEERAESLRAALARLSADHREVLERFYLRQEGTQLQIAGAMGLSVQAFNSRLNRARIELKRAIQALRNDPAATRVRPADPSRDA